MDCRPSASTHPESAHDGDRHRLKTGHPPDHHGTGEKKVGVILVSDDLPELMLICDRVIVMRPGPSWRKENVSKSSEQEITQIVIESAP